MGTGLEPEHRRCLTAIRSQDCVVRIPPLNPFWYRNAALPLIQCKLFRMARRATENANDTSTPVVVRPARRGDLEQVIAIDAAVTGLDKRDYWRGVFRRYGAATPNDQHRQFLVAAAGERVAGYV